MNLVNYACELSLFNAHAMILIFHIFMNANKLFLKPSVHPGDTNLTVVHVRVYVCVATCWSVKQDLSHEACVQKKLFSHSSVYFQTGCVCQATPF